MSRRYGSRSKLSAEISSPVASVESIDQEPVRPALPDCVPICELSSLQMPAASEEVALAIPPKAGRRDRGGDFERPKAVRSSAKGD